MSHNRIPIVCLVLSALTASAFIATQLSTGQADQANNRPLKMKVMRDKTRTITLPGPWEIAAFKRTLSQERSEENERKLDDLIPKHVPIKIKIKKEKEAGFKNANNEKWAREFELEVTNTGTKPIYAVDLYVVTDVRAAAGFRIVFPLSYGRKEFWDIRTKAEPTDIPINPGESISLRIHPGQLDAWDHARRKENRPFPKQLKVEFQFLSFGDGTGYAATDGQPLPSKTPEENNLGACLPSTRSGPFDWKDAPPGSLSSNLLAFNLPVPTWPVNFLAGEMSKSTTFSSSLPQTCCSGSNCSALTVTRDSVCVNCPLQNRVGVASCSNPNLRCGTTVSDYIECFMPKTGDTYFCQTIDVIGCGPAPAPSPSPSSSPSPSPSPTPTPCPIALPSQCPGGVPRDPCTNPDPPPLPGEAPPSNPEGCPFGYEASGVCCVPIACPQPTPTPPSCPQGEISTFFGPPTCAWSDCFTLFPDPSPTPTPSETEQYKRDCIDYYWVWFVSYDGGRTWQPTGQVEYAGCFLAY